MSPDTRPATAVDVVLPFLGADAALERVAATLAGLSLGDSDTVTIVDNAPVPRPDRTLHGVVDVISASDRQTSYFARNVGARRGRNPWIVFLDGDVRPAPDLIARYDLAGASPQAGVLAGGIIDAVPASTEQTFAVRYALSRQSMSHGNTLLDGPWAYAQTANCAVRRSGFEQVGGFRDDLRSGGDADFAFRLRARSWELELRPAATAEHLSRPRVRKLLAQRARHGSGAAWLDRTYPGSFPAVATWRLAERSARSLARGALDLAAGRRQKAAFDLTDLLSTIAFELGRRLPNETTVEPGRLAAVLERTLIG